MKRKILILILLFILPLFLISAPKSKALGWTVTYDHPEWSLDNATALQTVMIVAVAVGDTTSGVLGTMNFTFIDPIEPVFNAVGNTSNIWWIIIGEPSGGDNTNVSVIIGQTVSAANFSNFDVVNISSAVNFNDSDHVLIQYFWIDLIGGNTELTMGSFNYVGPTTPTDMSDVYLYIGVTGAILFVLMMVAGYIMTQKNEGQNDQLKKLVRMK